MSASPWASGPGEILQHGLSLLQKDSDVNRRLAMISIDNAVELMVKTFLGLPKRVTGLRRGINTAPPVITVNGRINTSRSIGKSRASVD